MPLSYIPKMHSKKEIMEKRLDNRKKIITINSEMLPSFDRITESIKSLSEESFLEDFNAFSVKNEIEVEGKINSRLIIYELELLNENITIEEFHKCCAELQHSFYEIRDLLLDFIQPYPAFVNLSDPSVRCSFYLKLVYFPSRVATRMEAQSIINTSLFSCEKNNKEALNELKKLNLFFSLCDEKYFTEDFTVFTVLDEKEFSMKLKLRKISYINAALAGEITELESATCQQTLSVLFQYFTSMEGFDIKTNKYQINISTLKYEIIK